VNLGSSTATQSLPDLATEIDPGTDNGLSSKSQLSIVNLLYNPSHPVQSSPQLTDENEYQARNSPTDLPPNPGEFV
jgi:hypothetical protein